MEFGIVVIALVIGSFCVGYILGVRDAEHHRGKSQKKLSISGFSE
jgi:hypothetical protein